MNEMTFSKTEVQELTSKEILEWLDENGELKEFKQQIVRDTIEEILSHCTSYYCGVIPVLKGEKINELYGETILRNINPEYVKHNLKNCEGQI